MPLSRPTRSSTAARTSLVPLVLTLLAAALPARALAAQQPQPVRDGVIAGTVLSEAGGAPVDQATVTITGARTVARTDERGRFRLEASPGTHMLRVRALGYEYAQRPVTVRAGDTTAITIVITPVPQRLQAVQTTAKPKQRESFEKVPEVGSFTMRASTLRDVPVLGEPDVIRSLTLLPGLVVRTDYTAGYNVRGGESSQNQVLLDGVPVYNPFHLGGLFGTFLDETVGDVNLSVGGFPAPYGERLSSVLDVTTINETRRGVHGAATLSMLSSSGAIGGLLLDDRTSWSIAARRTYADAVAAMLTEDGLPYHFWDGQAKLRHLLGNGGSLSLTAYAGRDIVDGSFSQIDDEEGDAGDFAVDWGNQLVGAAWVQPFGPGTMLPLGGGQGIVLGDSARLDTRASATGFTTGLDLGDGSFVVDNDVTDVRGSMALTWWTALHERRFGAEVSKLRVREIGAYRDAGTPSLELGMHPLVGMVHWDDIWRLAPKVQLRWGARVEHVTGRRWTGISPRATAKWFATPDMAFTLGGGRYAQWTHAIRNEDVPVRIFDSWVASDEFIPVAKADHAIMGAERWFGNARFARVEAWGKKYYDVPEQNPADDSLARGDEFVYARGVSYGVDVLLRRLEGGPLSGWVSYGYSVSSRERDGVRYAPAHDRRHTLNALVSWRLPSRWQVAGRLGYGSGVPYTDIEGQIVRRVYNGADNQWDSGITERDVEPVGGVRNGTRYPMFYRIDLTASREYAWRGANLVPFLSVINATNRRNVFVYRFDYTENPPTRTAFSQFPILPTLGLTVRW
jgi:hypothetical protein